MAGVKEDEGALGLYGDSLTGLHQELPFELCNHIDGITTTSIAHESNIAAGHLESVHEEALEMLGIGNNPIERLLAVVCRILVDSYDQSVDCFRLGRFAN